jgi:hypothetical protein
MQNLQEDDPQNIGVCLRTPQKLLVVHSDLLGKIHIEPYSEFLNKPFMNTVKARSFETLPQSAVSGGATFVEELRALKLKTQDQSPDFFSKLWRNKLVKVFLFDSIAQNTVAHFLYRANILNHNPLTQKFDYLQELMQASPVVLHKAYELSSPIMIRSCG